VRLVRDTRPDILHVHSSIAGAVVRLALLGQRGRTKLVYTPHSWAFSRDARRTQRFTRLAERWLSNLADSIVCVSEAEQRDAVAAGIAAEKCMVVQNGIAASSAASARVKSVARGAASKRKVLFVGRFDRQKGFDTFLDVMRRLGDEAEGLAVGTYVVGKAKAEEVPANVRLLGWRSREELAELYAEADLLLMPSRWEGLPLVALEAVRAGLPVFASRVGGLEEVILDGVTGRLFEADQPEATVAMIRATSRATLAAYGARGVARFLERFTAERMSRHIVAHYEDLLARGARRVLQNASVPVGA
jgi:glycosyltransferase involved in cell wall biosynthesis